jgi:transcriptional regulator with XRE-family HTH domain
MTAPDDEDLPLLPGFREMAARRRALLDPLVARRVAAGLTQTEVAARMGTSQSSVARLESGAVDARLSTLERYAAVVGAGLRIEPHREAPPPASRTQEDR